MSSDKDIEDRGRRKWLNYLALGAGLLSFGAGIVGGVPEFLYGRSEAGRAIERPIDSSGVEFIIGKLNIHKRLYIYIYLCKIKFLIQNNMDRARCHDEIIYSFVI